MSRSTWVGFWVAGLCIWLLSALTAGPALAGGEPSAENCAKVGTITVKCKKCDTGDLLGTVVMEASYDGSNTCLPNKGEARERCAAAANLDKSQVGIEYKYMIGTTEWSKKFPSSCNF